jgi:hypothetical protein
VLFRDHKFCLVYCFSGKCVKHKTVPVVCLGESYCWLILVENIIFYVCDCKMKYFPLMFLKAYRAGGWRVNMLKDNMKMFIKEIVLRITRTENNFINTYSQYRHFQSQYLGAMTNILPSWFSSENRSEPTMCHGLLMLIYATPHHTSVSKIV